MSGQQRRPRLVLIRDILSFAGGWYLMIFGQPGAEKFELMVFLGGMVVSGVPGVLQALPLLLGRPVGAAPSPQPSAPPALQPAPSTPSQSG